MLKKAIWFSLFCSFVLIALATQAQRTKSYKGNYTIGETTFYAQYDYYISRGDTLKQGKFSLNKPVDDSVELSLLSVNGQYKRNKPEGEWSILLGDLDPVGQGLFKDYNYYFKVSGEESLSFGKIDTKGKEGTWSLYERNIAFSEVVDTLFYAEFPFKENRLVGQLNVYNKERHLKGTVDENTFVSGTWTFSKYDTKGKEIPIKEWVFEGNTMIEKRLYLPSGDTLIMPTTQLQKDSAKIEAVEMEIDTTYFHILDLITNLNNPEKTVQFNETKDVDEDFYQQAVQRFFPVDSTLHALTSTEISKPIIVKINKLPYSETELELLDSIENKILAADSLIASIQKDPQINLAKISTPEVNRYLSILTNISSTMLEPVDSLIELYEEGFLVYLDRDAFIEKVIDLDKKIMAETIIKKDTVAQEYQFKSFKLNADNPPVNQLSDFANVILDEIHFIRDSLNFYVFELKKEKELVELEKVLIQKYEDVKELNNNLIGEEHQRLAGFDLRTVINGFLEKEISSYSSMVSIEKKIDKVGPLIECVGNIEGLIRAIEKSTEDNYTIVDAYTNQVFNPYTMTTMEEKVKSNIFKAYDAKLLPGVFNNLKTLKCSNVIPYTRNFNTLFNSMIEVLKRDTRKEEKKVKRADDPQKAADVLGFKLIYN